MKFNNLIVSVSILLLVLFLSIGIATANENNTVEHMELGGDDILRKSLPEILLKNIMGIMKL